MSSVEFMSLDQVIKSHNWCPYDIARVPRPRALLASVSDNLSCYMSSVEFMSLDQAIKSHICSKGEGAIS